MDTALPQTIRGYAADEWNKLIDRARTYLAGVAQERRTTTYKDLQEFLSVDRFTIAYVLGEVTKREKDDGRPSLSALVLYADRPIAGDGFTDWSKRNEWLSPSADDEESYVYWLKEMHACWVRWG